MTAKVLSLVGAMVVLLVLRAVYGLRCNILKARKTGLKYVLAPFQIHNPLWLATGPFCISLLQKLPKFIWEDCLLNWLFILIPGITYQGAWNVYERAGAETFLVVSPGALLLMTASPEAIHQITSQRERFPKDLSPYAILRLFGKNVVCVEGQEWRMHRKVISASFNETNAGYTFGESIKQTEGMLEMYFGRGEGEGEGQGVDPGERPEKTSTPTICTLEKGTMTLALNVIGYIGFGLRLLWPGQQVSKHLSPSMAKYASFDPPAGHSLTFANALARSLEKIFAILLIPEPLLRNLKFEWARSAFEAKSNLSAYFDELLQDKIEETRNEKGGGEGGMDIMGQLVRSKYGQGGGKKKADPAADAEKGWTMTEQEIIGNAFISILAGHETTANVLMFSLTLLAFAPTAQRAVQRDVDGLYKGSDPQTWEFEQSINPLLESHVGAALNETMRLVPPGAIAIPKMVSATADQALSLGAECTGHDTGKGAGVGGRIERIMLPAGIAIDLVVVGAHRNPRVWPTRPSRRTGKADDLDDFVPERWFRTSGGSASGGNNDGGGGGGDGSDAEEDLWGPKGSDTGAMFRPVQGSYLPFSLGPRACLGRRIAQVEMAAALAVVMQRYSIELAVDEWATDAEVAAMERGGDARRRLYARAQQKCMETIHKDCVSVITPKLRVGAYVPVRLVKRGFERFVGDPEL